MLLVRALHGAVTPYEALCMRADFALMLIEDASRLGERAMRQATANPIRGGGDGGPREELLPDGRRVVRYSGPIEGLVQHLKGPVMG